jgi:hypothetical protein
MLDSDACEYPALQTRRRSDFGRLRQHHGVQRQGFFQFARAALAALGQVLIDFLSIPSFKRA